MASEVIATGGSAEEFVRNLVECGLTGLADLRSEAGVLATSVSSGSALADRLVAAGKLTAYQASAILERRFGDLVMGNYEILTRLGAGGMGTVYKARHRRMKRIVALKVLSCEGDREEAFAQRFQREVETIARLTHSNIVMAFDADESDRGPFLVMEFIDGRDLASEVFQGGPLSVSDAVDCLLQAARGLEYAHAQGIVHRDIKPGNILRDTSGVIKVADLGLARLSDASGKSRSNTSLTQAGGIVGTLDYMPPEQALDSSAIDHRVDIYALGCTLHFLLLARPPYQAVSIMALLLKHREAPIPSLRDERPDVAPELDAIFRRMVAKAPGDRFSSTTAVVAALEGLKRSVQLNNTRPGTPTLRNTGPEMITSATVEYGAGQVSGSHDTSRVTLPAVANPPAPSGMDPVAGRVVVLAEPSRTQAGIIRRYLQQLGVGEVHATGSGREAVELAKRAGADALICSMHLSDMTGLQLAHTLLADPECTRVGFVLATSETETEEGLSLPQSPRAVLMPKPFDVQRLAASIAAVIQKE